MRTMNHRINGDIPGPERLPRSMNAHHVGPVESIDALNHLPSQNLRHPNPHPRIAKVKKRVLRVIMK
jgi:hypothetical protein